MNILWLAWKDSAHPLRGGAEVVLRELLQRQVADGHNVTLLTAMYPGAKAEETVDGVRIIRVGGSRYTHSFKALGYYLRNMRGRFDVLIETVNTAPYFSLLFRGRTKAYALYHQLAREVWFSELKAPLSHFGYYVLEPVSTRLLAMAGAPAITVSESTKRDLGRYGWRPERTHLISEGIEIEPVADLAMVTKYEQPTMLGFGALRSMKRNLDQIKAFELAKRVMPELKLIMAGSPDGTYGQAVIDAIRHSPFAGDITYFGPKRPSLEKKIELMQRSHIFTSTAVKEGWGLTVTEANSQGTPAVAYDADGLRDSVQHGRTGLLCEPEPGAMAERLVSLLKDPKLYQKLQQNAWEWSRQITFDQSYKDLKRVLEAS